MTGPLLVAGLVLAFASGLPGLLLRRSPELGQRLSTAILCLAAVLGISAALPVLAGAPTFAARIPWHQPNASLALRLDPLSAIFLVPILLVPALGSIYGNAYWPQARLGVHAIRVQLWYGVAAGAMGLVVVSDNAMLFLAAWETMALAGFFLVRTDPDRKDAPRASWIYLAASHVGTLSLIAFMALAGSSRGSYDFADWAGLSSAGPGGTRLWLLALFGFGLKAGLVPLHFWLPGAHAAAPSHVSAIMSGVLLKTGVYGIFRSTSFFDAPPVSWGALLVVLGVASGILGVALALAQHDLKRLLAYHSVENIGIITMGLGLAVLGRARGEPALVLLGFAGGALHVVNHALFKSLLFLGAGSVQHGAHTRDLDHLGGLGRAMPFTAGLFLVGAAAISGLPPLNGFVSEWTIMLGAASALDLAPGDLVRYAVLVAPSLALVGGLASACFVKVQGSVFLGNPRTEEAAHAHESSRIMLAPMAVLAAACVAIGLLPPLLLPTLTRGAAAWSGMPPSALATPAGMATGSVERVAGVAALLVALVLLLTFLRRRTGEGATVSETWGCGFPRPTARMQYTASSFAQILNDAFRWALFPHIRASSPRGLFPTGARFSTEPREAVLDLAILPALRGYTSLLTRRRGVLAGRLHLYALLVLATLVALLAWRFVWW